MHVKLASLKTKIDNQFKLLGKLTYNQLKNGESLADKISETILTIDRLKEEIAILREKIEVAKKAYSESREKDKQDALNKELEEAYTKEEYKNKTSEE